ncbi:MAG: hypothetical protein HYX59_01215 [Elusimicrobia bacterium]|nr:hypothetical protein [Elusimicrobiota bacterium]
MDSQKQDHRSHLRFSEEAVKNFSFLEDLGFKIIETSPTLVRFESPSISISVFHGRRSYEVSLDIASKENPTRAFPFYYLLWAVDPNYKTRVYAAESAEDVAKRVRQLAEIIKPCIDAGILNDKDLFAKFDRQSKIWSHEFALDTNLYVARRAWKNKNYREVVRVLTKYININELSPADLDMLKDAEKHLANPDVQSGDSDT